MSQDTKSLLLQYPLTYARTGACFHSFKTWTRELLDDLLDEGLSTLDKVTIEQVRQVPLKDLEELGFRAWSNEIELLLIPIYLVKAFKEDEVVIDINNKTAKIADVDLDVRYGLIAYGFKHPELKTSKEE